MPSKRCNVGTANDLAVGAMKEMEADGKKILLTRLERGIYATSAQCPHYGASLAEGLLCEDRVVCPWHKAVFRVTTGELLEPPAADALSCYKVTVDDGCVFVHLPEAEKPASDEPEKEHSGQRCFVLAGAGAAGAAAAERLRTLGFDGRIVALSPEPEPPYDRTKLSKEFLSGNAGDDDLPLRPANFWEQHRIERVPNSVAQVNVAGHSVVLSDGSSLPYDRLLLATGSTPRNFHVPGADLGNIFSLRSHADARKILDASSPGVRIVVVGGSFIAMEAASCFALRKLPVTVILPEDAPFAKQLGPQVGRILQRWHESNGVTFRLKANVQRFEGTGIVRTAVLGSGEKLPADLVVIGVGVRPATNFAGELAKGQDGGIIADASLQAAEHLYVAGDLAVFPETYSGRTARIEHWRLAEQQGRCAAENMLGYHNEFSGVPYFWTNHFGTRFDYLGHAPQWDEVILEQGEFPSFLAFYVREGRIVAAAACRRDREMDAFHELIRVRRVPTPDEIRNGVDLVALATSTS